jgi:hypothetical protein
MESREGNQMPKTSEQRKDTREFVAINAKPTADGNYILSIPLRGYPDALDENSDAVPFDINGPRPLPGQAELFLIEVMYEFRLFIGRKAKAAKRAAAKSVA